MYVTGAVSRDNVNSPFYSTHVQTPPPRTSRTSPSSLPARICEQATVGTQRFSQFHDRARILPAADPSWNASRPRAGRRKAEFGCSSPVPTELLHTLCSALGPSARRVPSQLARSWYHNRFVPESPEPAESPEPDFRKFTLKRVLKTAPATERRGADREYTPEPDVVRTDRPCNVHDQHKGPDIRAAHTISAR